MSVKAHLAKLGVEADEAEGLFRLLDDSAVPVDSTSTKDPMPAEDPVLAEEVLQEALEGSEDAENAFRSVTIPFVANAPDYTSKLYGANARGYSGYSGYSTYSGATTQRYSGATTRTYSGATTSGYPRGFSSPTSVSIPFKANTASYGSPRTTVTSSGFSSYSTNAGGYSSSFSSGFSSPSSVSGFSSPRSVTIPFKANAPNYSAPRTTPVASSYASPAWRGG